MRPRLIIGIIWCFVTLMGSSNVFSQSLPPFKMVLSNNKIFSVTELPSGKPIVVIYFDPDCDHCQKLMTDFFKKITRFRRAEIVMITFKSIPELLEFEKKYDTRKYANIRVGTEGSYFYLRNYYQLLKMPFTALYDKKHNLVYSYREETKVDDLISRIKKLQ